MADELATHPARRQITATRFFLPLLLGALPVEHIVKDRKR
jgi:hypothetical protein